MAMTDYGAILKIDGKQINYDMFMETSDCDYCPEYVDDDELGKIKIKGNYFVYAGDEDLLLCFYKRLMIVVSKGKAVFWESEYDFTGETVYIGDTHIRITRIDNTIRRDKRWKLPRMFRHCKSKVIKDLLGEKVWLEVKHKSGVNDRTNKFYCEWWYKGKHYEVAYGYGIDQCKETYDEIKFDHYDYTDKEREFLDGWY